MKRRSLATATILSAGVAFVIGAGASEPHATAHADDPARTIHPTFPLLDRNGEHVLDSGAGVSPTATCGQCHDTAFIAEHDLHAKISRRDPAAGLARLTAAERTSWERADGTLETDCFVCHVVAPNEMARRAALDAGRPDDAPTAELVRAGLVSNGASGWEWQAGAFDAQRHVRPDLVAVQDPTSEHCGACHGLVGDLSTAVADWTGDVSPRRTLRTGEVFSSTRLHDSTFNLENKEVRGRAFDVHAERLLECVDCHHSLNHPVFREAREDVRPEHLRFDARRLDLRDYLERPSHELSLASGEGDHDEIGTMRGCTACHDAATGHEWLPYAERHFDRLSCVVCHVPEMAAPALRSVDAAGDVAWRGTAASVPDALTPIVPWAPVLIPRREADGRTRLAPHNLVTEVAADGDATVRAFPIAHGVTSGKDALRDCSACHDQDSRLTRPFALGASSPRPPRLAEGVAWSGEIRPRAGGAWDYVPDHDDAGLYVLGHDSSRFANVAGIGAVAAVAFAIGLHALARVIVARRRPRRADVSRRERVHLYSRYERLWHWLQALAIFALMATGVGVAFPAAIVGTDFATMVRAHNVIGFVVVANALLAAFYHVASGEIRQFLPSPAGFFDAAIRQTRYYVAGIFRDDPHPFERSPQRKLNPLQQLTYLGILNVLLPLQTVTGILIWSAQRWPAVDAWFGGLALLVPLHALGAWLFAAFLLAHIYLTTTGPTPLAHVKAMIRGWDLESTEPHGRPERGTALPGAPQPEETS
ncbi:MAG: cytochrome b/b6 domain-containing protein [bacterium]